MIVLNILPVLQHITTTQIHHEFLVNESEVRLATYLREIKACSSASFTGMGDLAGLGFV